MHDLFDFHPRWLISPLGDTLLTVAFIAVLVLLHRSVVLPRRRAHAESLLAGRRRTLDAMSEIAERITSSAACEPWMRDVLEDYVADLRGEIELLVRGRMPPPSRSREAREAAALTLLAGVSGHIGGPPLPDVVRRDLSSRRSER